MSVTSGFFNSVDGDRRYNANDMSRLFSGVITDGVFMNVGNALAVKAYSGTALTNAVIVESGRAWFNNIWINNDDTLIMQFSESNETMNRYDAIIIDIDSSDGVRDGYIRVITGIPSTGTPDKPAMTNSDTRSQHPLAYIYRAAGSTNITQANIQVCIGTSACPYITSILKSTNIDNLVSQWKSQWDGKVQDLQSDYEVWYSALQAVLDDNTASKLTNNMIMLQNQLNELSTKHTIGSTILDSKGYVIEDNKGAAIEGTYAIMFDSDIPTTDEINAMFW